MKLKTVILGAALIVALLSISQAANAATAYYVARDDVYVRSHAQGYAMGRLYRTERMDIQYIDSRGWAYGFAYGYVNRCVWAQYREGGKAPNFGTHGTTVNDKCRNSNRNLNQSEFTNGRIWGNDDGEFYVLPRASHMWDNWVWGRRWGNANHRGMAPAGSLWKIRYITNDGGGVMARRCRDRQTCFDDWIFLQRSSIN